MKQIKKTVLFFNEKYLLENIQSLTTKNTFKVLVTEILQENNYLDKTNYDSNLYKLIYENIFSILFQKNNSLKDSLKIYSELNFIEYFTQNYYEYTNFLHPQWNTYPANNIYNYISANRDFYTFYRQLYEDNMVALDFKNAHVIVNSNTTYNNLIDILCSEHKIENNKITNLIYFYENFYADGDRSIIRRDTNETTHNVPKNIYGDLRKNKTNAFKLTIMPSGAGNENFTFNTNKTEYDIFSQNGIQYASIYEMLKFYLSTITIDTVNVPTEQQIKKDLLNFTTEALVETPIPSKFRGVSLDNEYANYRLYPNKNEGYIKPFERYFAIKYCIKNILFDEDILLSILNDNLKNKYNHIKNTI
jgi:hypothetical protein